MADIGRKFHTTIVKTASGDMRIDEVSLCQPDCPDYSHELPGGGREMRISGSMVERVEQGRRIPVDTTWMQDDTSPDPLAPQDGG